VQSTTILAHVRAASPGLPVLEVNCHPFRMGRLTFMHNGGIAGFGRIKRAIQASV
jgi:glutamine amidotransferase